jgi:hypothetical protein
MWGKCKKRGRSPTELKNIDGDHAEFSRRVHLFEGGGFFSVKKDENVNENEVQEITVKVTLKQLLRGEAKFVKAINTAFSNKCYWNEQVSPPAPPRPAPPRP